MGAGYATARRAKPADTQTLCATMAKNVHQHACTPRAERCLGVGTLGGGHLSPWPPTNTKSREKQALAATLNNNRSTDVCGRLRFLRRNVLGIPKPPRVLVGPNFARSARWECGHTSASTRWQHWMAPWRRRHTRCCETSVPRQVSFRFPGWPELGEIGPDLVDSGTMLVDAWLIWAGFGRFRAENGRHRPVWSIPGRFRQIRR